MSGSDQSKVSELPVSAPRLFVMGLLRIIFSIQVLVGTLTQLRSTL